MKNINTYFEKFNRGKVLIDFNTDTKAEFLYCYYRDREAELEELDSYNNSNGYMVIASLGLWNGRKTGYRVINDVADIPFHDYTTIYKYRGEMVIKDSHHDGTNYYLIRRIKSNFDTLNVDDKFYAHIYNNKCKLENLINYYTEKLDLTVI